MSRGALSFAHSRSALFGTCFSPASLVRYFGQGGNTAWPIQSILRKEFETSEESPLELRSPYCSDPDCEYWKELREIEDKCKGQLAAKRRVGAGSAPGM
jgi:hypothetical protein